MTERRPDEGFTLIEVLLVILVLGLLAAVVVNATGGLTARAEATGCEADAEILYTATEAYFAQRAMDLIPAADATPDGFEITLVSEGFLRAPSTMFDLDTTGDLLPAAGSACTA